MLQPSFRIHQEGLENADMSGAHLFIDAGTLHFAFGILLLPVQKFIAFEFYQFKSSSKEDDLEAVLKENKLLSYSYKDVLIAFNTRESVLIPAELYKKEDAETMLSMIHGDLHPGILLQEHLAGMDIFNIYQVPGFLHKALSGHFSNGHYWHVYSTLLQVMHHRKNVLPSSYLYVNFYPNQVIVAVMQDGVCQLVQTFQYDIPEDVSYHLLNITEQFVIDNTSVPVILSGLVDKGSALYAELLKYFLQVKTDTGGSMFATDVVFESYPAHFFTPVFSLALCE
jgi:hypothetical protein